MNYRELVPSDAKAFLEFKKQIAQETQNTLLCPEVPFLSEEEQSKNILNQINNQSIYNLCVFDNKKMVGYLNFRIPFYQHPWVKHLGSFGMMVLKDYWGQGIGTKLLMLMEDYAKNLKVNRIEASVRVSNENALRLYQKNGYSIEGTKVSAAYIDSSYHDEFIIAKLLNSEPWNPPTIISDRLILRPLSFKDVPYIFEYTQLPEVSKYTTWQPHTSTKDVEDFILNFAFPSYQNQNIAPLGIVLKADPKRVIGTVDCAWVNKSNKVMELAYALHSKHWGQGIATEACLALIKYCFENTNVVRIQGRCHHKHKASRRVMEKVGMTYEGTLKSLIEKNSERWDLDLLAIIRN